LAADLLVRVAACDVAKHLTLSWRELVERGVDPRLRAPCEGVQDVYLEPIADLGPDTGKEECVVYEEDADPPGWRSPVVMADPDVRAGPGDRADGSAFRGQGTSSRHLPGGQSSVD